MIGVDQFSSVFGGEPAHTAEHLAEHLRAVIRAGYSPVLCKPGGKETACILSAAGAKRADRTAQDQAVALNPRAQVSRIRHSCGFKHVLDDPAKVGAIVKRFTELHRGANVGLHLGRSRLIVVDVDTPAERQAFVDQWPVPGPGYVDVQTAPGITVESPGSYDYVTGTWKHWGGGHWWFTLPDEFELPPGKVLKMPGGWAIMYGEAYALTPPSSRPEGAYRLVGGTSPAPAWMLEALTAAGEARRHTADQNYSHIPGGPIDQWSARTSWAELLEPRGWIETSMVEGSCGCPVWTAPGEHSSPKSATAHGLECARFDVSEGWGPLKIWTDHPPDGLPPAGAVTKLQFIAASDHTGDDGAAIKALGIERSPAPPAWAVPTEWREPLQIAINGEPTRINGHDPFTTPGQPPDPSPPQTGAVSGSGVVSSSWDVLDLGPFLDGTYVAPVPAMLHRTDGQALFYPRLTHSVYGETESAKSWIVLLACAQQIRAGQHVLMIDTESDPGLTVHRLRLMGCSPGEIREFFHYIGPWSKPAVSDDVDAWLGRTLARPYALCVIDTMAGAMGLYGLKGKDDDDVTTFHRIMPGLIVDRTGAAVVIVDHVIKDKDTRGRWPSGSERKVSALTGAAFSVRRQDAFGQGQRGSAEIWIAKDRAGGLRGLAGAQDRDGMQPFGTFVLDSSSPSVFTALIEPPPEPETEQQVAVNEAIRQYLRNYAGSTMRSIREAVPARAEAVAAALAAMVADGSVMVETHGRAHLHRLAEPLNIDEMSE